MRMTLYYFGHAFINQIRKLLHTWVAIFLLVCMGVGMLVGVGVGVIGSLIEEKYGGEESEAVEIVIGDDSEEGAEERGGFFSSLSTEERNGMFELAVGGVALLVFALAVFSADRSGGAIFLPADVNLLFPAPLKPQSVLIFRLIMQMGGMIAATIYLLFQIPSLVFSLGLSGLVVFALYAAWAMILIWSRLVSVLLYTVTTTHPSLKRYLRTGLLALLAVIAVAFLTYARGAGSARDYFAAALGFFNAPATRYIPVWGWLKLMTVFALEGKTLLTFAAFAALLALMVLTVVLIWRIKADFYEDAMARSEETAAAQAQAREKVLKKRRRDRSEKLRRDGLDRGAGASVYLHKTLYNRFRFAYGRVFTKTCLTYLAIGVGVAALLFFLSDDPFYPLVPLILSVLVFFRALGNPIAADADKELFVLVPDSAHKKVFYSFLGGAICSALDLLPAFVLSAVLLRPNPFEALLWFLLVVSMGIYADSMGLFIGLSLPTGLSQTAKSFVQIIFLYVGLVPAGMLIALGYVFSLPLLFVGLATIVHLAITALSLSLSPLFIIYGRR